MSFQHATIWLSRSGARVLRFEDQHFPYRHFKHTIVLQPTGQGSEGAEDFFEALCLAVEAIPELLLTGTPEAIAAFECHAASRRPGIAARIVGVQRLEKPTDARLSALTRWHFVRPAGSTPGEQ